MISVFPPYQVLILEAKVTRLEVCFTQSCKHGFHGPCPHGLPALPGWRIPLSTCWCGQTNQVTAGKAPSLVNLVSALCPWIIVTGFIVQCKVLNPTAETRHQHWMHHKPSSQAPPPRPPYHRVSFWVAMSYKSKPWKKDLHSDLGWVTPQRCFFFSSTTGWETLGRLLGQATSK